MLEEVNAKHERVARLLNAQGLAAVLLRRRESVAWVTAGLSSRTVASPSESAIASVLLMIDGRRFYFAANNEAARLADEDFNTLGFEPVVSAWFDDALHARVRAVAGQAGLGSDTSCDGYQTVIMAPLRWQLFPGEISRYRVVCRKTAAAVSEVLLELQPGMDTREIEARVCYQLHRQGIAPTVLLIAADERIRRYKHALTQDNKLQRFGMINLCARKWGLAVSLSRYVHFGDMPKELESKFAAATRVYATLINATREGTTSAECYESVRQSYKSQGFSGEEREHHQGGAAGYVEREWLARPGGEEVIRSPQAFAWNPSVQGAKVEDTILLHNGRIEVMTETPELPTVQTPVGNGMCISSGVLIR